jgi:hypothetical protein
MRSAIEEHVMRASAIGLAAILVASGAAPVAASEKGLSFDDAIVFDGVSNEIDGVGAEHLYTDQHEPAWTWQRQALVHNGGRVYDVIDLTGPGGETKSIYFDITDWFGKMP